MTLPIQDQLLEILTKQEPYLNTSDGLAPPYLKYPSYSGTWTHLWMCDQEVKQSVLKEAHRFFGILKSLMLRNDFPDQESFEKKLRFYLKLRWLVIHHSPSCYFNFYKSPINQACINIAMTIQKEGESIFEILAFTLNKEAYYATSGGNLSKHDIQTRERRINFHWHIPSDDLQGLNSPLDIFKTRENNSTDRYFSSFLDKNLKPFELSPRDKLYLRHAVSREDAEASSCSEDYYVFCMIRYGEIPRAKGTLAYALYYLQQGLYNGSMSNEIAVLNNQVGELQAGTAADKVVKQFASVWTRLTEEQKRAIDELAPPQNWQLLAKILRRLLMDQEVLSEQDFARAMAENTFHCVDLMQKNISANLAEHKTELLKIRYEPQDARSNDFGKVKINDENADKREEKLLAMIGTALNTSMKQRVFPFVSLADFEARCQLYNIESNSHQLHLTDLEWDYLFSIPEIQFPINSALVSDIDPTILFKAFIAGRLTGASPVAILSLLCSYGRTKNNRVELVKLIPDAQWNTIFPTTQDFLTFIEEMLLSDFDDLVALFQQIPIRFYDNAFPTPQEYHSFSDTLDLQEKRFLHYLLSQIKPDLRNVNAAEEYLPRVTSIDYDVIRRDPLYVTRNLDQFRDPQILCELFQNIPIPQFLFFRLKGLIFEAFPTLDQFMPFFNTLNRFSQSQLLDDTSFLSHYLVNSPDDRALHTLLSSLPAYFSQGFWFNYGKIPSIFLTVIDRAGYNNFIALLAKLDNTLLPAHRHFFENLWKSIVQWPVEMICDLLHSPHFPLAQKTKLVSLFITERHLFDVLRLMKISSLSQQQELLRDPSIQIAIVNKLFHDIEGAAYFTDAFFDFPETLTILRLLFKSGIWNARDFLAFYNFLETQYKHTNKERFNIIQSVGFFNLLTRDWSTLDTLTFLNEFPPETWDQWKAYYADLAGRWGLAMARVRESSLELEKHIALFSKENKKYFINEVLKAKHTKLSINYLLVIISHCETIYDLENVFRVNRNKCVPLTLTDLITAASRLLRQNAAPLPFERSAVIKILFKDFMTLGEYLETFVELACTSKLSQNLRSEIIPVLSYLLFEIIKENPAQWDRLCEKLNSITVPFSRKMNEVPFVIAVLRLFPVDVMDSLAPFMTEKTKQAMRDFINSLQLPLEGSLAVLLDPEKPSWNQNIKGNPLLIQYSLQKKDDYKRTYGTAFLESFLEDDRECQKERNAPLKIMKTSS
jgi:hypothetical protein